MLVLTRKKNEKIVVRLGDVDIVIDVYKVTGNRVTLAFDAPKEVVILRGEIDNRKELITDE